MIYATTWMNPENMLSEISQTQGTNTVRLHLLEVPRIVKIIDKVEEKLPGAAGRAEWRVIV